MKWRMPCLAGLALLLLTGCPPPVPDTLGIRGEWAVERILYASDTREDYVEGVSDPTYLRVTWNFRADGRLRMRYWVDEAAMAATGATPAEILEAVNGCVALNDSEIRRVTHHYSIDDRALIVTITTTYTDPAELGGERLFQFFISESGGCRYWELWDDLNATVVTLRRCD